ncbi:Serine/threonine protein kinase PrkC, regulator of stationary phase [Minicystis rosea]|nr:Serine/threonine protein kinase PrkC, regulator of stationary phase [Minicystis rosea]
MLPNDGARLGEQQEASMDNPAGAPHNEGTAGAPPAEALPRQFGKYTLLRRLAAGGMAEIFLALHRSMAGFEKLIVIKRILPSMNQNKAFIEMLLHEARIAATLSHPNIVQIFDVGQVDGTYFIAMEHIHGEDIQAIVRAMKKKELSEFPLEHTLSLILGTCAGLAYAHDRRDLDGKPLSIVHRDISPRNIVVSFTGDVKIVDFGIAKSGVEPGEDTNSGQLKGKAPYMSPEQASGQSIDWRSDIFATGVMLFELTTGRRLFKGASEFETLKLIVDKEYPRPSEIKPDYPPALERIVMKALEKDREERYQSARDMQADLEAFVREERIPVSQVSLTSWMGWLFEDKLAQQKEALQDIKQLADVIAAQQGSLYEGGTSTGTGVGASAAIASLSMAPPSPNAKKSAAPFIAVGVAVALGVGGFAYMQREDARRKAADAAAQHAAQASSAPAEPQVQKGSIDITTKPDGAGIWINGDLRPETTPAHIDKLPLGGTIKIKLTKEGFEAYREDVTLTDAAPTKKLDAEMKTGSVTVVLKIDPPPTVWLDGKAWKGERTKLEGLSAGEEHTIVVSASGFQPKTFKITAQQGETKTVTETLTKVDPNAPAPAAPAKEDKTDKPAPAAGGPAKVRVGAKGGFCNVTVNGTSYGPTPVEAPVSAGTVRVSCKPASGAAMSQTVQVQAGETARVSFKVEQ